MNDRKTAEELLSFLEQCPSAFHTAARAAGQLLEAGFVELQEKDSWKLEKNGKYFVKRNDSSLIAFQTSGAAEEGFRIAASHSDSPAFQIKEYPEMEVDQKYVKLNVERYGGMIMNTWMDRPLSVAGRIVVRDGEKLVSRLVNVDRDLIMIPNVAIHMNREVNQGYAYNAQKDMLPLYGLQGEKVPFLSVVADAAGVKEEDILGHDLFLYNRQKGSIWGAREEFISGPRLDDLQCVYGTLQGFLQGKREVHTAVYGLFDNEEVGSGTRQGAASTFLQDVLLRINMGMGRSYEDYLRAMSQSCMISADNAHGIHPNHPEFADPVHHPVPNGGLVIKYSGNQKYCTNGMTAAFLKDLCERAEVPVQIYVNRSDIPGGSTLGNIAVSRVPVPAVDVGLAQLAMHSAYETAGVRDTGYLIRTCEEFFS